VIKIFLFLIDCKCSLLQVEAHPLVCLTMFYLDPVGLTLVGLLHNSQSVCSDYIKLPFWQVSAFRTTQRRVQ